MYTLGLLAAGLVLLLLLGRREHLAFTDTVKDITRTVDQAEQDRIFEMAPVSLRNRAISTNTEMKYPIDKSKTLVANILQDFLKTVYVPATAPITDEAITAFASERKEFYRQMQPSTAYTTFFLDAYSTGDATRLIQEYLKAPASTRPLSTPPTSGSGGVSVPQVLEQMKQTLLDYKMTGKSEYKTSYDGLKAWMDRYISTLSTQLTRDADRLTSEVDTYRNANPEIEKTQVEFQRVAREGPQVENTYLTIKKQMDQTSTPDYSGLYVKGAIALGLVIAAAVLSFF